MRFSSLHTRILQIIFLTFGIVGLLLFIDRTDFVSLIGLYILAFSSYLWLAKSTFNWTFLLSLGIGLRIIAWLSIPQLSDDFYRFLWDGQIWSSGIHPYLFTPQALSESEQLNEFTRNLYPHLNSPNYFTVYPPLNQILFALPAIVKSDDLMVNVLLLKLPIFMAEIGTILLLPKLLSAFSIGIKRATWYILNPLVIVELSGNGHFEGVLIFFLLLALYLFKTNKLILGFISFWLAVNVKLTPLILLPFLYSFFGFKKLIWSFGIGLIISSCFILPFLDAELIANFSSSIQLYFQGFTFNSYFYNILFDLLPQKFNSFTGILLLLLPFGYITLTSISRKTNINDLSRFFLLSLGVYFMFSAVIHPWYICTLIALTTLFFQRWVIAWSGLIMMSYFTYRTFPYEESNFLIALEYLFLFSFMSLDFIENRRKKNRLKPATA